MNKIVGNNDSNWEEKISNQKLYERNFFLEIPIKPELNPPKSDKKTDEMRNNRTFLLFDNEIKIANYWYRYVYQKELGLNTRNKTNLKKHSIQYFLKMFNGNRPWLHSGFAMNINVENELKLSKPWIFGEYKNSTNRDCINLNDLHKLQEVNTLADIQLIEPNLNIYPQYTSKWFNNNTRAKILYP